MRENGISILIPTQNEEAIVALCILSFLDFGDELIVVDNGSVDHTKQIIRDLAERHPRKVKFYDKPSLPDLYHNRQFAFSQSSYRWVVRADSDYVAYTSGKYSILPFRDQLLSQKRSLLPKVYAVPQVNVVGDFWHTGVGRNLREEEDQTGQYTQAPTSPPMLRIYEVFPGFRFKRLGRWEGVRFNRLLKKIQITLEHPLWMQCSLKSTRNYLFRSERTNWREFGEFDRYPTLESYVQEAIQHKYDTQDIDQAAQLYFQQNVCSLLKKYDPEKYYPYPELVRKQMALNSIYRIVQSDDGKMERRFLGVHPLVYES